MTPGLLYNRPASLDLLHRPARRVVAVAGVGDRGDYSLFSFFYSLHFAGAPGHVKSEFGIEDKRRCFTRVMDNNRRPK